MKANLLLHLNSFCWEDLSLNRSEALENLSIAIQRCNDNNDMIYSNPLLYNIVLPWGDLYEIITFSREQILQRCPWLSYDNQKTLAKLFGRPTTALPSDSLQMLHQEFVLQNNSWLGLSPIDLPAYVSDEKSWKSMHSSFIHQNYTIIDKNGAYFKRFYVPKFMGSTNQVKRSILQGREHTDFERLDIPTFVENDITLHGEQIQMHFKNGTALNMNGVWKHGSYLIPARAKEKLIEWGFLVP